MGTVIRATLTLAVRLIDTTTGREITETDVRFYRDDRLLTKLNKGPGIYVFTGESRENFLMRINARGFDVMDLPIRYEALDQNLPMCDIFLMPSENNRVGGVVLELKGTLSKLQSIEAIATNRPVCMYHSCTEKKGEQTMVLLPKTGGAGVFLDSISYALYDESLARYEVFEVQKQQTPTSVTIKEKLGYEHRTNEKICRINYGQVSPDGTFLLKVREDASALPHLIRFVVNGNEYFRPIDAMQEHGEIDLMKDAVKTKPSTEKETVKDE